MPGHTGLTQQDPERFAELAKALLATPEAQAMIRESGAKTYDDLSGGKGLVAQMFKLTHLHFRPDPS